ncbi:MAG: hypothetical protein ACK4IX_07830, partial [Candidatus Sericytochromatia bacterium]
NNKKTYISLNKKLDILSMTYNSLSTNNPSDSLLVIDSSSSSGSLLKSFTYDFIGKSNSDYSNKSAIDKYDQVPSKNSLKIANFSKDSKINSFEQTIINVSAASSANVNVKFYTLVTPKVLEVKDGKVTWSTAELGNIPKELLKGYDVYKDNQKLNPFTLSANQSKLELSLEDDAILESDNITVVIKDKKGNSWPEVEEAEKVIYPNVWIGLQSDDFTKPLMTMTGKDSSNDIGAIVFNNKASDQKLTWKGDSFNVSYTETVNAGMVTANSEVTMSGSVDFKKNILLSGKAYRKSINQIFTSVEELELRNVPLKNMGISYGLEIKGSDSEKYVTKAKTTFYFDDETQSTGSVYWNNAKLYIMFSK